ncbi:MAG TPA: ATP-binding cassette domain-containing protein [Thermoanaerobaculia bacterium]
MTLSLDRVMLPLANFTLDVSFTTTGTATALYGPSGAGKTTVLELIAGLRRPQSGTISFDGEPLSNVPVQQRRIGYVTQDDTLFPHLSVRHNIEYGARNGSLDRVASVLDISGLLDRSVRNLSGGEKKRVALARALMSEPRLLLLDEPLAEVDTDLRARILDYLVRVRHDFPIPLVYVTHAVEEARALCDEIVAMERGRVLRVTASG